MDMIRLLIVVSFISASGHAPCPTAKLSQGPLGGVAMSSVDPGDRLLLLRMRGGGHSCEYVFFVCPLLPDPVVM